MQSETHNILTKLFCCRCSSYFRFCKRKQDQSCSSGLPRDIKNATYLVIKKKLETYLFGEDLVNRHNNPSFHPKSPKERSTSIYPNQLTISYKPIV